ATLEPDLERIGFQTTAAAPDLNFTEGFLPIAAIPQLTGLFSQGMMGAVPLYRPATDAGAVNAQGGLAMEADRVRATLPNKYDGSGVRVGALSDSYNALGGAANDIRTGDLPSNGVQV